MKRAASLLDQRDVGAVEFSSQEADWKEVRRRHLCCLGCHAPAQFKAGSQRRGPFFSARHHDTCPLTKAPWTVFRYLQ